MMGLFLTKNVTPLFQNGYTKTNLPFFPKKIIEPLVHDPDIQKKADLYVAKQFDLLGSGPVQFSKIPWRTDIRLQKKNPQAKVA